MQESLLMSPSLEDEAPEGVMFLGEVPASEFITGNALAAEIGLTAGTAQHSNAGWLHFELDGKTLYVAKRPFRHSVTWDQIHARGAVYGTRTVTINGEIFKVRLLKGADVDPTPAARGFNPTGTHTSEWNRLIYNVHNGVHAHGNNTTPPGYWPLYSDTDLVVQQAAGNGNRSWCQEADTNSPTRHVYRGINGVSYFGFGTSSLAYPADGWRPVLE